MYIQEDRFVSIRSQLSHSTVNETIYVDYSDQVQVLTCQQVAHSLTLWVCLCMLQSILLNITSTKISAKICAWLIPRNLYILTKHLPNSTYIYKTFRGINQQMDPRGWFGYCLHFLLLGRCQLMRRVPPIRFAT